MRAPATVPVAPIPFGNASKPCCSAASGGCVAHPADLTLGVSAVPVTTAEVKAPLLTVHLRFSQVHPKMLIFLEI